MTVTKDTPYNPISCATHDGYEIAVMRRQQLQIEWLDADQLPHTEILIAKDLETLDREEFLLAESINGTRHRIRLDRIKNYSVINQNQA